MGKEKLGRKKHFTMIPNEVLDRIFQMRIPTTALKVFLYICRETWGWQRKAYGISLEDFTKKTGLTPSHVVEGIRFLVEKEFIKRVKPTKKGGRERCSIYEPIWLDGPDPAQKERIHNDSLSEGDKPSPNGSVYHSPKESVYSSLNTPQTGIETLAKRECVATKSKEKEEKKENKGSFALSLSSYFSKEIQKRDSALKGFDVEKGAEVMAQMIEEGKQPEDILEAIDWTQEHSFWQTRILNPEALRRNWKEVSRQIEAEDEDNPEMRQRLSNFRKGRLERMIRTDETLSA